MKDSLVAGMTTTQRVEIDAERTTDHLGEDLQVYSTPSMAYDIEVTCRDWVLAYLDEGEDTVGARIEIDHLGATLLGMWVDVSPTIVDIDGRRIMIEIDVHDAIGHVGKAKHVRFVIDKERQKQRVEAKAAKFKEQSG